MMMVNHRFCRAQGAPQSDVIRNLQVKDSDRDVAIGFTSYRAKSNQN
jgi:hypothetical protein